MKMYFVTNGADDQSEPLSDHGADHQMISYWYVKDKRPGFIRDYVVRGNGQYIDEEALTIRGMTVREFFDFLSNDNIKDEK